MAILTYSVAIYFLLFASALALSAYLYVTRNFNHWKKKKVPFVKPLPFFGSYKDVILRKRCVAHFVKDTYANNKGRFVGVYLIDAPALIIRDPELIRTILIKDFNHFVNRAVAQNMKADPIGSSVLFSLRYRQWRPLRHEMVTAFTAAKMKQMFTLMAVSAESMREYLSKASPAELQTKDLAMKYTVDVMASCAFGTEAETFRSEEATFWAMVKRLFDYSSFKISFSLNCYFVAPLLVKALHLKFMEPVATEFLRSLTLRIIEERVGSGKSRGDLVDILVRIQKSKPWIPGMKFHDVLRNYTICFVEHQLVAQSVQFVAAGYETTSSALTFLLYELASDQALQERLRADIKAALPSDGSLTFESLKDMKYLDCCFKGIKARHSDVLETVCYFRNPSKVPTCTNLES